jgi:hypothetical protein
MQHQSAGKTHRRESSHPFIFHIQIPQVRRETQHVEQQGSLNKDSHCRNARNIGNSAIIADLCGRNTLAGFRDRPISKNLQRD